MLVALLLLASGAALIGGRDEKASVGRVEARGVAAPDPNLNNRAVD